MQRAFLADAFWGLAAVLWIATGLIRVFGPYEKGSAYYFASDAFLAKMLAFALILIFELWPMATLIRWRILVRRGTLPEPGPARSIARVSYIQAGLVLIMVFAATAMARGHFFG